MTKTIINLKKIYILGLILLSQTILFGQDYDIFPINVDSIKSSGIDTFFIYKPYCYIDGVFFPKNATEKEIHEIECDFNNHIYVFFKLKGNAFVTKYNKCYKFSTIKINTSLAFSYFTHHHLELIKDSIRDASVKSKDGSISIVGTDHSCYRNIYLFLNQSKYFNIDLFDLNKKVSFGNNINFSYNSRTHIKNFIDIISKELENLKFIKQDMH